ncbi:MAG: OmpA family protein [Deltaproteobacteria bacterium]|nr:OmpA family protein [Deltaproteobacteria bacterium]
MSTILCVLPGRLGQYYGDEIERLRAGGVLVVREDSPMVALSAVGTYRPRLVVAGLSMPEMEGLEFVALVQAQHAEIGAALVVLPNPGDAIDPLVCTFDRSTGRYAVDHYAGAQIWDRVAELCGVADGRPAAMPLPPLDDRPRAYEGQYGLVAPQPPLPPLVPPPPAPPPRPVAAPPSMVPLQAPPAAVPQAAGKRRHLTLVAAIVVLVLGGAAICLWLALGSSGSAPRADATARTVATGPAAPTSTGPAAPAPDAAARPVATGPAAPTPPERPAAPAAALTSGSRLLPLSFRQGSPQPDVKDEEGLRALAAAVRDAPRCSLTLVGHSSEEGAPKVNHYLGRERARASRALLVARGARAGALATDSAGARDPIVKGATGEAAAANRRVVLEIKCP